MPPDLLSIARRHLSKTGTPHERNERNEQSPLTDVTPDGLSSYSSFFSSPEANSNGWGCHRSETNRLLSEADDLVEALGVPGTHPEIAPAVNVVASAYSTRDIEILRFAVFEFTLVVKVVASAIRNQSTRQGGD